VIKTNNALNLQLPVQLEESSEVTITPTENFIKKIASKERELVLQAIISQEAWITEKALRIFRKKLFRKVATLEKTINIELGKELKIPLPHVENLPLIKLESREKFRGRKFLAEIINKLELKIIDPETQEILWRDVLLVNPLMSPEGIDKMVERLQQFSRIMGIDKIWIEKNNVMITPAAFTDTIIEIPKIISVQETSFIDTVFSNTTRLLLGYLRISMTSQNSLFNQYLTTLLFTKQGFYRFLYLLIVSENGRTIVYETTIDERIPRKIPIVPVVKTVDNQRILMLTVPITISRYFLASISFDISKDKIALAFPQPFSYVDEKVRIIGTYAIELAMKGMKHQKLTIPIFIYLSPT